MERSMREGREEEEQVWRPRKGEKLKMNRRKKRRRIRKRRKEMKGNL